MAGLVTAARSVVAVAAGAVWRSLTRHRPDPTRPPADAADDGCPTPGASAPPSPPPTPPPGRLAPARPTETHENEAGGEPDGAEVMKTHDTVAQAPPPPAGPPPPLSNALGANLCFFNAVMQGLASAPPFVAWVQALGAAGGGGLAAATLLTHLATSTGGPPRSAAALLPPGLKQGQQQDAAEAGDLFLAALETAARAGAAACAPLSGLAAAALHAATPAPAPTPPLPRCPLAGTIVTQTVCAVCASPAAAHVAAFTCLPLVLPPGQKGTPSLQGLLAAFAGTEAVAGVECGRCSLAASLAAAVAPPPALAALAAARAPLPVDPATLAAAASLPYRPARRTALRRCLVARPPPVLLLHVGRVRCAGDGAALVKLRGGVGDLGPVDVGAVTAAAAPPLLAGSDAPRAPTPALLYDVVAAVAHVGASPGSGHYVAYRRRGRAGEWWGVSDAKTWRAAQGEVEAADVALCVCVRR